jgi:hypothetical protein
VGGLAHYLERGGVPTTELSLIREHTERIRPPRALWVPFPFGRPFGTPGDAAFQTGVVVAALRLLERTDTPVLHDYPAEADAGEEVGLTGLSCPVQYRNEAAEQTDAERIAAAVALEVQWLRPWYDITIRRQQSSAVGVTGLGPEELVTFIAGFLSSDSPPNPCPDLPLIHTLKLAAEDLHAYYRAAALAQPGPDPTAHGIASWFWRDTTGGRLIHAVKRAILERGDPTNAAVASLLLVPFEYADDKLDVEEIGRNFAALVEHRDHGGRS